MGIDLHDLSDKIGIARGSLSSFRSGKRAISPKTWIKLAAAEREAGIGASRPDQDDSRVMEDTVVYGAKRHPTVEERLAILEGRIDFIAKMFETLVEKMRETKP